MIVQRIGTVVKNRQCKTKDRCLQLPVLQDVLIHIINF